MAGGAPGRKPGDLDRLQALLDRFPDLYLDSSARNGWCAISRPPRPARDFFIRNPDRILFGTDQVSGDNRGFDFLASRIWAHRKLWETAYTGPGNIFDPDCPPENQPPFRGLALPNDVLQKIYHDNAVKLLHRLGMDFD